MNMAYGLSSRLFIENGPAVQAAGALGRSSAPAFRAWRKLDVERRLQLVDAALLPPSNDL
jgi:hypothetical protein